MAHIPIRMPKMSMTMTEGEVSEWFVEVGDSISEGDVVCEVLTDKVDMEVESPATGVVSSITVESGSVDVGTPIGYIEGDDSGGLGDLLAPEPASTAPIAAVPRARGLAREHGIDLAGVAGTGPNGRVLVADIEVRLGSPPAVLPASEPTTAPAPPPTPTATDAAAAKPPSRKRAALVRARVAEKMVESAAVPQFTVWRDLTLDPANRHRQGLSWTTVLLGAYSRALRQVPELLCRWESGAVVATGPPSIGLAVDTPHGLLAPVLVAPDDEDAPALDRRVRALVAAAQTGRVDSSYLQAANAMISNLGGLGVDRFQALVTPPQASVLSVGSILPRPVAVPGGIGTALIVTVGLTVDHRVADGAQGARLLAALNRIVTAWGENGGDDAGTA